MKSRSDLKLKENVKYIILLITFIYLRGNDKYYNQKVLISLDFELIFIFKFSKRFLKRRDLPRELLNLKLTHITFLRNLSEDTSETTVIRGSLD